MIRWLLRRVLDHFAVLRDPVAFHRRQGVRIGERVELVGAKVTMFGSEPYLISIDDDATISSDVAFVTHDGGLRIVRHEHPGAYYYAPIRVGARAFVGTRSVIMPGVTIGDGAVVGAASVVTRDVPANTVVAGVPARYVKSADEYAFARQADWISTRGLSPEQKREVLLARLPASGA